MNLYDGYNSFLFICTIFFIIHSQIITASLSSQLMEKELEKTKKCPSADGHFFVVLHAALKGLAVSTLFLSRIGLVGTDGDVV